MCPNKHWQNDFLFNNSSSLFLKNFINFKYYILASSIESQINIMNANSKSKVIKTISNLIKIITVVPRFGLLVNAEAVFFIIIQLILH